LENGDISSSLQHMTLSHGEASPKKFKNLM
jgi:hypothetical protein